MSFKSFAEFYPFYLSQHKKTGTKKMHIAGCLVSLILLSMGHYLVALLSGYALSWIGHFFIEKNEPATFKHPVYSFMGDWRMVWDISTGKIPLD